MQHDLMANALMFWAGIGSAVVSFFGPVIGMRMEILSDIHSIGNERYKIYVHVIASDIADAARWAVITAMAAGAIAVNFLLVYANKMAPPAIVSMVRIVWTMRAMSFSDVSWL